MFDQWREKFRSCVPWIHDRLSSTANLVCPPVCFACERIFEKTSIPWFFCADCHRQITVPSQHFCHRCGSIKNSAIMPPNAVSGCSECRHRTFRFSQVFVLGEYRDLLRRLLLQMKRDRDGTLASNMARLFLDERDDLLQTFAPDIIVPVPMHFVRRWYRGVNNPVFFAHEIGHHLNVPVLPGLIRRTRYTKPQFRLKPKQRLTNVRGAFAYTGKKSQLSGKHLLIVDDIMTTGATCNEVAKVLMEAGAARVSVAVFARAEGMSTRELSEVKNSK